MIANLHAFSTRADRPSEIARDTLDILKDWLAAGIDPERATVVVQSEVRTLTELNGTWSGCCCSVQPGHAQPYPEGRARREGAGRQVQLRVSLYAVGQCADILAFRPALVPVGEDQLAHIEVCREVARRFNHTYRGVDPATPTPSTSRRAVCSRIPEGLVGRVGRLVGVDGTQKMSKSLGNAIYLTDTTAQIKKKVGQIFTGRVDMNAPGDTTNALFQYVRSFITDAARVAELTDRYRRGDAIGDGHVKAEVATAIDALLAPMRERRARFDAPGGEDILYDIIGRTRRARTWSRARRSPACGSDEAKIRALDGTASGPGDSPEFCLHSGCAVSSCVDSDVTDNARLASPSLFVGCGLTG